MRIELYHLWDCPYSARVRDFIERNRMRGYVEYVDVDDEVGAEERLVEVSGGPQVPCLVIDGRAMLGSDDIIAWLRRHFLGDRPTPSLA